MKIIFKIRAFRDANPHIKPAGLRIQVDERARGKLAREEILLTNQGAISDLFRNNTLHIAVILIFF